MIVVETKTAYERILALSFRSKETRRKILIGAFVLDCLDEYGIDVVSLDFKDKKFSDWLFRDDDRALFDLCSMSEIKAIEKVKWSLKFLEEWGI